MLAGPAPGAATTCQRHFPSCSCARLCGRSRASQGVSPEPDGDPDPGSRRGAAASAWPGGRQLRQPGSGRSVRTALLLKVTDKEGERGPLSTAINRLGWREWTLQPCGQGTGPSRGPVARFPHKVEQLAFLVEKPALKGDFSALLINEKPRFQVAKRGSLWLDAHFCALSLPCFSCL